MWVEIAKTMLKEAGFPELVPFIKPSKIHDGHFTYHGRDEIPYTLDRVHALCMAWHLVHIASCRRQPACWAEEQDLENWKTNGINTHNWEQLHYPPTFDDVLDAYEQWAKPDKKGHR